MGWLKKKLVKWLISDNPKAQEPQYKNDEALKEADNYLRDAMQENKQQLEIARRLNKANLIRNNTKALNAEVIDANRDNGDEDYDDEEEDDPFMKLLLPFITSKLTSNAQSSQVNLTPATADASASANSEVKINDPNSANKLIEIAKKQGWV